MGKTLEDYDFGLKDANLTIVREKTDNVIESKKCNQCDYAFSQTAHLRIHLKMHSEEI